MLDNAVVGVIIAIVGVASAIFYNAYTTLQNTKTHYYTIRKDLETRLNEIEDVDELDARKYLENMSNFGIYLYDLINDGIIKRKLILPKFKSVFEVTLWVIQNILKEKSSWSEVVKFCDKYNIKEKKPSEDRMIKLIGHDIHTIVFSNDPNKNADIYTCPHCKPRILMFRTKKKLEDHLKEKHDS